MLFLPRGYVIINISSGNNKPEKMNGAEKMKFYYNDKVIRTSKTMRYKFAVISEHGEGVKVFSCSETRVNAQKSLDKIKRDRLRIAESNLKFAKNSNNTAWLKERYGEDFNAETQYQNDIESIKNYKIVELEER